MSWSVKAAAGALGFHRVACTDRVFGSEWSHSPSKLKEKRQRMILVIFAAIGLFVGYRLEMTRAGYVTMALTAVGSSAGQIIHLVITKSREAMTMLPLVVGLVLVLCMLLGALVRLAVRGRTNAA